jgi:hypothetical protein
MARSPSGRSGIPTGRALNQEHFSFVEGSNAEEGDVTAAAIAPSRSRVLLALGALFGFSIVVAIVAVTAGGNDQSGAASAAAPRECLDAWNQDSDALAFARHNSIFHNYNSAQVGYLTPASDASVSSDPGAGECVVVFARNQLDPEALAAGQILENGVWTPLTGLTDINTVARLQSEAFEGANAKPTIDGEIVPKG